MRDRLEINNISVDVFEETSYSITSSIIDIREPDKRKTDFSKTITIPGTKNNNLIFSNAFQLDKEIISTNNLLNYTPEFNPSLKATATLYIDELPILIGSVQLLNIIVEEGKIIYEIVLFGQLSNIYYNWKDKYLTDIDFSDLNHALTVANQQASWSPTLGEGYVYPLIDYGYNNSANTTWNVIDIFPAIFVKEYLDRAFALAGFSYTSAFFDSSFFKSLIIPFNRKSFNLSNAQIAEREFDVFLAEPIYQDVTENSSDYPSFTAPINIISWLNWDATDIANGFGYPNTNYPNATGHHTWKVMFDGTYNVYVDIRDVIIRTIADEEVEDYASANTRFEITCKLRRYRPSNNTVVDLDVLTVPLNNFTFPFTQIDTAQFNIILTSLSTTLQVDDQVYVTTFIDTNVSFRKLLSADKIPFNSYLNQIGFNADFFKVRTIGGVVSEGDTVIVNNIVPDKIKISDLFNSIVKMFNLYVDIDKDDETNLLIKPVNSFYNNTVRDWTNKVDVAKGISIQPMAEVTAKTYNWRYKEDKDYYNQLYIERNNGNIYGNKTIDINNDFVTGEQNTDVIFSPTPLVGTASNNICTPAIFALDKQGNKERMDSNIRLLYWGGYKALNTTLYHVSSIGDSTSYTDFYPFAAHIDDVLNPTIDINFDITTELFYPTNIVTNNNIYNAYHRAMFNEISNIDSKLVTLYVKITPLDKLTLSFADLYFIDNNYYRLHKIEGYDVLKYGYTKCEFLKIKAANPFISSQRPVKPAVTNIDILQGGVDEVRSPSATSFYNLVQGGQDEVRDIGATSVINLFQGGQNTV
jgi:hypothetical protein